VNKHRRDIQDKYSEMNEVTMLGFLSNAMSGGDRGQTFPYSDAEDMSRGLRFIPGEVTVARREGQAVPFMQSCHHRCCWYWQFPDGARTYYWERWDYQQIAEHNGKTKNEEGNFAEGAGPCPECGNIHTRGGYVKLAEMDISRNVD
jgi:hypothetical protein